MQYLTNDRFRMYSYRKREKREKGRFWSCERKHLMYFLEILIGSVTVWRNISSSSTYVSSKGRLLGLLARFRLF